MNKRKNPKCWYCDSAYPFDKKENEEITLSLIDGKLFHPKCYKAYKKVGYYLREKR